MKRLYIEGSSDTDNGSLKNAFAKLFEKELKGNMPRIVMGDGRSQTIDKFCTAPFLPDEERYLLIDSDKYPIVKREECDSFNEAIPNIVCKCDETNTFFMIQEVEAWILSQLDVLCLYKIIVPQRTIEQILQIYKPSEDLAMHYEKAKKKYHKVRDFSKLFPSLNVDCLRRDFSDFRELLSKLKT